MKTESTPEERSALDTLDDVAARGMQDAIPNRMAKQTKNYDVQYGVREDDKAMVFHFFPPGSDPPKKIAAWNEAYKMNERLERALPATFDVSSVTATYTEEMRSFCIIVGGLGRSMDPWHYVHRFFAKIDEPL